MAVNYNIPFQTQLDYMMYELQGPESRTMDAFKSAGAITPQDYAELFEQKYERAGGHGLDRRKQYALEVFKGMNQEVPDLPQNVIKAYKYFTGQGFTPAQASGIVGNLMTESYAHLDPNAYNPAGGGQGAYGIAQFRGPRLKGLLGFAEQQGDTSMDGTETQPKPDFSIIDKMQEASGGLRGVLDFATQRNPETGLSKFEAFAAALDPLMLPSMRAGGAIKKQGQARVQSGRVNKTIQWLRDNGYEDIAAAVEANPQSAANVMSSILAQRNKTTDQFRVATPEEAAQYGAVAGQFDKEGRFYPTQKTEITEVRDDTKFTEAGQKEYAAVFSEMAAAGREANMNLGRIKLLGDLLEQSDTGIMAGLASRAASLGLGDFRGNAAAAAEAIISQLVPAQRPPGSGTISDADLALYKASLPSIAGRPGGNKLIVQSMIAIAEHNKKVGAIASKALTDQNYSIAQAEADIAALPDPFESVRGLLGASAPAKPEPLDGAGALDILKQEGIIDGEE
jgi:hypothetical protein